MAITVTQTLSGIKTPAVGTALGPPAYKNLKNPRGGLTATAPLSVGMDEKMGLASFSMPGHHYHADSQSGLRARSCREIHAAEVGNLAGDVVVDVYG
jgi:hypothetical protein